MEQNMPEHIIYKKERQMEEMKDILEFCPHKELVEGFCKKCRIYACRKCIIESHFDHLEEIKGLDSLCTEAIQKYSCMSNSLEKHLLLYSETMKDRSIDSTMLEVEKRIGDEYDKLIQDIKEIEEEQAATIRSTPFLSKIQKQKLELEGEDCRKLKQFDEKLEKSISRLLGALADENYENVADLIKDETLAEYKKEAEDFESYYEKQKQFLKNVEILKSVKPILSYNSQTIEDLVLIKGVHEEILKLFMLDTKSGSIYVHIPKIKTVKRCDFSISIPTKPGFVATEDYSFILCGGKDEGHRYSAETWQFFEAESRFLPLARMNESRANHGICVRKETEVFVAGGENSSGYLKSAEMFNLEENTWRMLPSLNEAKKNMAMCIFSDKYLYAIGGFSGIEHNTIELLNLNNSKGWEKKQIAGMLALQKAGAVQIAEYQILLFGGKIGAEKSTSTFIFDVAGGNVTKKKSLTLPCCFHRSDIRKSKGTIYATGNQKFLTFIYEYASDEWLTLTKDNYQINGEENYFGKGCPIALAVIHTVQIISQSLALFENLQYLFWIPDFFKSKRGKGRGST